GVILFLFFFSSRRRHTRSKRDWSSDVCSSDLLITFLAGFIVANLSIDSANTIAFLEFFQINFVGFLLFVAIGSYSLLISALFNDERNAFALALGITFIFYAL